MGVFYKQRDNLYYPVTAFAAPAVLLRVPLSAVIALAWALITYFPVNMDPSPGRCAADSVFADYGGMVAVWQTLSTISLGYPPYLIDNGCDKLWC